MPLGRFATSSLLFAVTTFSVVVLARAPGAPSSAPSIAPSPTQRTAPQTSMAGQRSSAVVRSVRTTSPSHATVADAAKQKALLDKYCVTCHNDRLKTANLSLEGSDLAAVG